MTTPARKAARYATRLADGVCVYCAGPRLPSLTGCEPCLARKRTAIARRRAAWRQAAVPFAWRGVMRDHAPLTPGLARARKAQAAKGRIPLKFSARVHRALSAIARRRGITRSEALALVCGVAS